MANFNERDARRFSLSPTVAVQLNSREFGRGATYHLPSSLLQKYTNLLDEPRNANDQNPIQSVQIDVDGFPIDFSHFVDWLYGGQEVLRRILRDPLFIGVDHYKGLWDLAYRLQAEELKNQMVDHVQSLPFVDGFVYILFALESFRLTRPGSSALGDYMCDKVAYEIMDKGWAQFIQVAGRTWETLMIRDDLCATLMKRLMEKLRSAYLLKKNQGELQDPATRTDCKWHEHSEKSKLDCHRYQPEPPQKKAKITIKPKVAEK
ncbi:hypothetical protein PV11_03820 [Exophiala sideris]|uniref:BTB domain-containing protein n=1 Tax=Exophiala sideris TaxID=1016849 RepID=A0A0D1X2A0_9EURO|nr:hypothetical protein PV11_03820 [Exophiala sideris]